VQCNAFQNPSDPKKTIQGNHTQNHPSHNQPSLLRPTINLLNLLSIPSPLKQSTDAHHFYWSTSEPATAKRLTLSLTSSNSLTASTCLSQPIFHASLTLTSSITSRA
jgi:hypothetical protein